MGTWAKWLMALCVVVALLGCADIQGRVTARLNTKIHGWEASNPGMPVTNDVYLKLKAESEAEIAAEVAAANKAALEQAGKAGDALLTGGYVTAATLAVGAFLCWLSGGKKKEPELPVSSVVTTTTETLKSEVTLSPVTPAPGPVLKG